MELDTQTIVIWVGALCTLAIYSILYRENPVFRLFEHIFVGLATGFGVKEAIIRVLVPIWGKSLFLEGEWYWVFAMLVGIMFYFIYSKNHVWIARWAMGLFIGFGAGLGIVGFVTEFVPQMKASFKPIVFRTDAGIAFEVNNLLMFVTLIAVMSYFIFSIRHNKPVLAGSAKAGRWLLMIAFGAIFGNTVMARVSLLIDRIQFLLFDWLPFVPPQ